MAEEGELREVFPVKSEVPHVVLPVVVQQEVALLQTVGAVQLVPSDVVLDDGHGVALPLLVGVGQRHLPEWDGEQVVQHLHIRVLVSLPAEDRTVDTRH